MIIVVLLLAAVTIAIPLFLNRTETNRVGVTRQKLNEIKNAIVGDKSLVEKGSRTSFGFVGDMGVLPASLVELMEQGGYPPYGAAQGIWFGWHGPYLESRRNAAGQYIALLDGWGNSISYTRDAVNFTAVITSGGPDGNVAAGGDNISVTILENEARSYVSGYFRNKNNDPISETGVTVYFPNGTGVPDSVQITPSLAAPTEYHSQTDGVSSVLKRKIPFGNRYFVTLQNSIRKLAAVYGNNNSTVNFVSQDTVVASPFFERTFYPTDDTNPETGSPIIVRMGNWQTDNLGNYYASGGAIEHRAVFGDASWQNYRLEVDATLNDGRGYGIYYRSDGQTNITGYVFQYDPGLYTPLGTGIEFVIRRVYQGNENYFPEARRFLARVRLSLAQFRAMFNNSEIYDQQHHISITVNGNNHIIKIDGQQIINVNDTEPLFPCGGLCGMCGLRSWDGQHYADFHHILVHGIPPVPTGEHVWWSFEEGGRDTVYGSGFRIGISEINGLLVNTSRVYRGWQADNIHGRAIYSAGTTGGYIEFTTGDVHSLTMTPTSAFSISGWVKMLAITTTREYKVISKMHQGNQKGWELRLDQVGSNRFGAIFFLEENKNNRRLEVLNDIRSSDGTSVGMSANTWYHIAVVYDGSGYTGSNIIDASALTVYLTARSASQVNPAPILVVLDETLRANSDTNDGSSPLAIAAQSNGDYLYAGYLDEFKIYKRALSYSEVNNLFLKDK